MPFVGMRTNPPHRFSRFQQRDREDGRFHGIAQHERVEAGCKELHGDWFGFAVGRHFVAAAGNHQHGRALAIRVDFAAVVKAVADERGRAAVDSGNFIFKITHDSMLSMHVQSRVESPSRPRLRKSESYAKENPNVVRRKIRMRGRVETRMCEGCILIYR